MDLNQFEKWIKELGLKIQPTKKHHRVVRPDGQTVAYFAITHRPGAKRYVKPSYIKAIKDEMGL